MKRKSKKNQRQIDPIAKQIFDAIELSQFHLLTMYQRQKYNLNVTNCEGRNGLFFALNINESGKRMRMIRFCLELGIDPLHRDLVNGYAPLHEAIARQQNDSFEIIFDEVKGEFDWNTLDNRGQTILHQTVETNNLLIMDSLLTTMIHYKVSVDLADKNGLTPYLLAVRLHLTDMANLLLRKGRASRQISDSQLHRSAQEWQLAGYQEDRSNARIQIRQQIDQAMKQGKINQVKQLKSLLGLPTISNKNNLHRSSLWSMTTGSGTYSRSINEMMDLLPHGERPGRFVRSRADGHGSLTQLDSLPPIHENRFYQRNQKYHSLTNLDQIGSL